MSFFGFGKKPGSDDDDEYCDEEAPSESDSQSARSSASTKSSTWSNPYVVTEYVYVDDDDESGDVEYVTEEVAVPPLFKSNWFSFGSRSKSVSDDEEDVEYEPEVPSQSESGHNRPQTQFPPPQPPPTPPPSPTPQHNNIPSKYAGNKYVEYEEIEVDTVGPEYDIYYEEIKQVTPASRLSGLFHRNNDNIKPPSDDDDGEEYEYYYEELPQKQSRFSRLLSFNRAHNDGSDSEDVEYEYYYDDGTDYEGEVEYEYYYEDEEPSTPNSIFSNIYSLASQGRGFDMESIGQMIGIARPQQQVHTFFHSFQDPKHEADLPRLPGEKPEWVVTPSLAEKKETDELFMEPVEVVFGKQALAPELQTPQSSQGTPTRPTSSPAQEQTSSSTSGPESSPSTSQQPESSPPTTSPKPRPTPKPKKERDLSQPRPKTSHYNYFVDFDINQAAAVKEHQNNAKNVISSGVAPLPGLVGKNDSIKPELLAISPLQPPQSSFLQPPQPPTPLDAEAQSDVKEAEPITLHNLDHWQRELEYKATIRQKYEKEMEKYHQTYYPATNADFLTSPLFYQHQANITKNTHANSFNSLRQKISDEDESIEEEIRAMEQRTR